MSTIFRSWLFLQDKLLGSIAGVALLGATLLAIIEIPRRYIFGVTFFWSQDAVTYFITAACFLYFGNALAQRTHLAVTVLPEWLQKAGKQKLSLAVRSLANMLGLLFCVGFVWFGWPGAERTMMIGRMTESMVIPLWPFQFVLLVGIAMLGITYLFHFYRDFLWLVTGKDPFPWDTIYTEFEL